MAPGEKIITSGKGPCIFLTKSFRGDEEIGKRMDARGEPMGIQSRHRQHDLDNVSSHRNEDRGICRLAPCLLQVCCCK